VEIHSRLFFPYLLNQEVVEIPLRQRQPLVISPIAQEDESQACYLYRPEWRKKVSFFLGQQWIKPTVPSTAQQSRNQKQNL
jgi:hypothetical protein